MAEKQVLVVDDDQLVRSLTVAFLAHFGLQPHTAASGSEALQKLEAAEFDLVITDLSMPDMNGDQLAAEIKKRWPQLPVVLITGTRLENQPPGFVGVLYKPFLLEEFRRIIDKALRSGPEHT